MNRRNLIYYSSFTGNTELVAKAIGEVFDKEGWETDYMKVGKGFDPKHHDIDFLSYDFLCVGSPVLWHVPFDPLLWGIRTLSHRVEYARMETGPKCGLAFTTYGGADRTMTMAAIDEV
ncbi:MAG: hypothetical protein PF503_19805 [Desulfobacula sp.]|jgi:flavorubredoxin|nr:hypothetical protein [Desulfobacula sp.]